KQAPAGLGNDNDVVGRYFMEHLEVASAELWLFKDFPTNLYTVDWGVTKASAEIAFTPEIQEKERILNGTASMIPLSVGKHQKPRMETFQEDDPRKSKQVMNKDFDKSEELAKKEKGHILRAFQLNTRIEQAPNPNSRVTLSKEKDELGVNRADLHWELTPLDKRSIRTMYKLLGQQIAISGLGRVRLNEFLRDETDTTFPDSTNGGWHHMGTTRMSADPKTGVVDENCKVHGLSNLYIASSGCYTTSGAPNPTLTLVALTLRLSNHLKSVLAG
ncbi:MAG: GMC family oxidoreductase, partial [Cyclobacteriaceae bacterium]|nr:GMC family oxidoreductase [Cyclobacteriaceae bacterium]